MKNQDQYQGCLVGGAAGDALGYEVEFMRRRAILREFGQDGITEYVLHHGKAVFSDDTQMTLFTADGLLNEEEPSRYIRSVRKAYLAWYATQNKSFHSDMGSGLLDIPELFARRAPGMTCMNALSQGGNGTPEEPLNDSKGCGGVMRTAPIGLVSLNAEQTVTIGAEAAALTHGHPLGWLPGGMFSEMIRLLAQEQYSIRDAAKSALETTEKIYPDTEYLSDFHDIIMNALTLADQTGVPHEAVKEIGEGWVGDEALAIAIYCAAKFESDFDLCLKTAVNHDGDSDSTGAIAGNLLGAKIGLSGIPEKYQKNLELYDLLIQMADRLYQKG